MPLVMVRLIASGGNAQVGSWWWWCSICLPVVVVLKLAPDGSGVQVGPGGGGVQVGLGNGCGA